MVQQTGGRKTDLLRRYFGYVANILCTSRCPGLSDCESVNVETLQIVHVIRCKLSTSRDPDIVARMIGTYLPDFTAFRIRAIHCFVSSCASCISLPFLLHRTIASARLICLSSQALCSSSPFNRSPVASHSAAVMQAQPTNVLEPSTTYSVPPYRPGTLTIGNCGGTCSQTPSEFEEEEEEADPLFRREWMRLVLPLFVEPMTRTRQLSMVQAGLEDSTFTNPNSRRARLTLYRLMAICMN